ncbi:MAG: hypothetical protein ABSH30_14180 [Acidimicrobiales bacterium]
MSQPVDYTIGAAVACQDGDCGHLGRVVVDPIKNALTHLVVEPKHRTSGGRLVPVELVDSTSGEAIQLRCTTAQFEALDAAEETEFLPSVGGQWGYGQGQMLAFPYFGLGLGLGAGTGVGGMGMGGLAVGGMGRGMAPPPTVTYDKVPVGEVEVRRGEHVHATDGPIGRVRGLVVDPSDYHVTHVLLDEGHLWGQKEVAIPISSVTGTADGVQLNLSRDEIRDLPPVDVAHHD